MWFSFNKSVFMISAYMSNDPLTGQRNAEAQLAVHLLFQALESLSPLGIFAH